MQINCKREMFFCKNYFEQCNNSSIPYDGIEKVC